MKKRAAFIGRWQPFHLGHEWLIRNKLDRGIPVLILVRDIPPDDKNPFTTEETISMIRAAFPYDDVKISKIADIESINWGRGVGYETNEYYPPKSIARISATDIRAQIKAGDYSWREFVNPHVAEWLINYYA